MKQPTDESTDAVIDREIQRILVAEPSPEFLARVRTRVASEPARVGWRSRWTLLAGGAIVAAIVMAVVLPRSDPRERLIPTVQLPGPTKPDSHAAIEPVPAASVERREMAAAISPLNPLKPTRPLPLPATAASQGRLGEPEVLVSAAEAQALRRLLIDVCEGRIELSAAMLPTSTETFSELVDIHPLIPATIREGVLQ